jgi:2-oxoacid dehydrogenases acyltransferase (catalytic domain)
MSLTKHRALVSWLSSFHRQFSCSAVINPPQGFILAAGKVTKIPVIDECDQNRRRPWHVDHDELPCRVIDSALGAEYLKALRHLLENVGLKQRLKGPATEKAMARTRRSSAGFRCHFMIWLRPRGAMDRAPALCGPFENRLLPASS